MTGMGKGALRIAIEDFLNTFGIGVKISEFFTKKSHNVEKYILDEYPDVFALLKAVPEVSKLLGLEKLLSEPERHQGALLGLAGIAGGLGMSASTTLFAPYLKLLNYYIDSGVHSSRIDPSTAIHIGWRNPAFQGDMKKQMEELGWSPENQQRLKDILAIRPGVSEVVSLWLRGFYGERELEEQLNKLGFDPAYKQEIVELSKLIPNPQDLVRMAVREAWSEEVVERFQYDAGFPPEFAEWMTKQGYSADWAKRFWRAHWELPGVSQAYEMVHRLRPGNTNTPFTLDDMRLLLKTADIPEFFRDRLIAISYNPYTRVDVRRLYGQDILTEDQVFQNYLDLGYDDVHARNLTNFTVKGAKAEEKGLTREAVTNLYRDAILGRPEAKGMLNDLGYNDTNAEFWLLLVDYALDAADDNAKIAAIHDQFVAGDLDDSSVMAPLGALNLPADRQARLLTQWVIQRAAKVKKPSAAQLEAFYKLGLVQGDAYLAGLLRYGFNAVDAALFIQQTDLEIQAAAVKEQERAQAAADKAAASTKATKLTRDMANLDAQIAQLRLSIANVNVALHQKPDAASTIILQDTKDTATIGIAQAVLDKALLRVTYVAP